MWMATAKCYVKHFMRKGEEFEISYLKAGIFFWYFPVLGHNLYLAILTETRDKEPLLTGPDIFFVPSNIPPVYFSFLVLKWKLRVYERVRNNKYGKISWQHENFLSPAILNRRYFSNYYLPSTHLPILAILGET